LIAAALLLINNGHSIDYKILLFYVVASFLTRGLKACPILILVISALADLAVYE
jgi:hypothetical protein